MGDISLGWEKLKYKLGQFVNVIFNKKKST